MVIADRPSDESDAADSSDAAFWESIYADGTPPWDKGEPAPPLVRSIGNLQLAPGSRVFVPGCGFGHEALFVARRGFSVTAVDLAAAAVDGLCRRAEEAGLEIDAYETDLFELPGDLDGRFDLIVEHTCFCAIPPFRRDDYVRIAARILRPQGMLLGLFFEVDHLPEEGPPYPTTKQDVISHFGSTFDIDAIEQPQDSFPSRQGREWLACMQRRHSQNPGESIP